MKEKSTKVKIRNKVEEKQNYYQKKYYRVMYRMKYNEYYLNNYKDFLKKRLNRINILTAFFTVCGITSWFTIEGYELYSGLLVVFAQSLSVITPYLGLRSTSLKRQWGFNYILTKKYKKRAEADVGLMFAAYNIRRIINILGKERLGQYLKVLLPGFLRNICALRAKTGHFKAFICLDKLIYTFEQRMTHGLESTKPLTIINGF